jgi:dipeptidase E
VPETDNHAHGGSVAGSTRQRVRGTRAARLVADTIGVMDVLLLSNSANPGAGFLDHAREEIIGCTAGRPLVFLPFALGDWDAYTNRVRRALPGVDVRGAHDVGHIDEVILDAGCVFAGGGNTFRLLEALLRLDVIEPLAERVRSGACSYIGSSAGTNIAAPTIRTTNDMPIVELQSLRALGLVPFQINPHFSDATATSLTVETRAERLAQFHERNDVPVVALYEGSWIRVRGEERVVGGTDGAKVFEPRTETSLVAGDTLDRWWCPGRFDSRVPVLANRHHRRNAGLQSI